METKTTIDPEEVERFSRIADEWWDPRGKFKPLHDINPVRIQWIKERLQASGFRLQEEDEENTYLKPETRNPKPTLLDIGCGGGLICEPFARLGAQVTGIDASEKNIKVAALHAERSSLQIDYRCMTAEELWSNGVVESWSAVEVTSPPHHLTTSPLFDIVLALEIVEHVADVELFVKSCAALVKPGGIIVMSTLNRTLKSYALAIVGAEYVLRWLPKGTHDWNKFIQPSELCRALEKNGVEIMEMTGMTLDPLRWKWTLNARDMQVNYLVAGRKC